jgi:hypothetical protein
LSPDPRESRDAVGVSRYQAVAEPKLAFCVVAIVLKGGNKIGLKIEVY